MNPAPTNALNKIPEDDMVYDAEIYAASKVYIFRDRARVEHFKCHICGKSIYHNPSDSIDACHVTYINGYYYVTPEEHPSFYHIGCKALFLLAPV